MQSPDGADSIRAKPTEELISSTGKELLPGQKPDDDTTDKLDITVHSTIDCNLSSTTSASFIGKVLNGHFELLALIGEGGMSYVYKAKDIVLNKIVAVKLLRPNLLNQTNIVRRLQTEALATSSLDHRNTVGVRHFDVTSEGLPYLVMVYLEGKSIADVIAAEGPLEPARAIKILCQMADALAHAHNKGIVHRDLKASNVLLIKYDGEPDFVKVVDFGIAKIINSDSVDMASHLTITGEIFGSPIAMSPEQCRGSQVDVRSDVYAFGCLMYQILTGQPVYATNNNFELLCKQLNDMPDSFRQACPQKKIPLQLEAITFKALQKDPRDRYQSMQELLGELKASQKTSVISNLVARCKLGVQKISRGHRSGLLLALCLIIIGCAWGWATRLIGARDQLLTQVLPWQTSPLPVLAKDKPHRQSSPTEMKLISEATQYEDDLNARRKRWADAKSPKLGLTTESEARNVILHLSGYANRLSSAGAYGELEHLHSYVSDAAAAYAKTVQPQDNVQDVRAACAAIKKVGDELYDAGAFDQAELVYWGAVGVSRNYCGYGSADDQFFSKLIADCSYKEAEYGMRSTDGYRRAKQYYDAFLPTKNNPRLITPEEFAVVGGQRFATVTDLAESAVAWDVHCKRAECEYFTNQYSAAKNDYQWIFSHALSKPILTDLEQALVHWHAADSERMSLIAETDSADATANDALRNYSEGLLWRGRSRDPSPKNAALCRAYMVALVERFNLPVEQLPGGVTATTLNEIEKVFGETDPTTLIIECQNADNSWRHNRWLEALKLWLHVILARTMH